MAGRSPRLTAARRVGALAVLLVALLATLTFVVDVSADGLRDEVDRAGIAAPVVFVLAGALLTVCLFPGPLTAGASGLLFGTALGTPITILTFVLGGVLAFSLGRWWAHDAVADLVARNERATRVRAWIGERGFLSVLYARIAPGVPYNLVNYAAGLAPVRLEAFVAATALGCAPRAFAYTALGGSLDDLTSPEAIVAVSVLVVMAIAGLLVARREARRARLSRGTSPADRPAPPPSRAGRRAGRR